jgi:hypothetical protein
MRTAAQSEFEVAADSEAMIRPGRAVRKHFFIVVFDCR